MQVEYRVGTQALTDGAQVPPTLGHQGQSQTDDTHARYYNIAFRTALGENSSFVASTGVAGVAPGTVLSTTPPFALWNPPGSGRNLYIIRVTLGYVSGTLGAGSLWYAFVNGQNTAPTTGTALTSNSSVIGSVGSATGKAYQGSTVGATPSPLRPSALNWGAFLATTAAVNPPQSEEIAGNILVVPGGVFVVQAVAAAGTTPLVAIGVEWGEERAA